jgi:hypothetical protein
MEVAMKAKEYYCYRGSNPDRPAQSHEHNCCINTSGWYSNKVTICVPISLSTCMHLSVHPIYPSLSFRLLSVSLSIYLSTLRICLSICLSVRPSNCLCLCLSVRQYICLSVRYSAHLLSRLSKQRVRKRDIFIQCDRKVTEPLSDTCSVCQKI